MGNTCGCGIQDDESNYTHSHSITYAYLGFANWLFRFTRAVSSFDAHNSGSFSGRIHSR